MDDAAILLLLDEMERETGELPSRNALMRATGTGATRATRLLLTSRETRTAGRRTQTTDDVREFLAKQIDGQLDRIALELRELADAVERKKDDVARIGKSGQFSAGRLAARVYQDIAGALVNAPVSLLISTAADYDLNT